MDANRQSYVVIGAVIGTVIFAIGIYVLGGFGGATSTTGSSSTPSQVKQSADDRAPAGGKKDKKEVAAPKYPAGDMFVYFGSQTGTAEGFARTIMEDGKAKGFNAKMVDLEEFDPDSLASNRLAIFLMATYGEGEPTDNAARFTKWIKNENDEIPEGFLSKVQFTVFGLGNRQYEHFNKMGKVVNAGLEKLGAKRVFEYGEGDDDGALEEDFETWKAKLWPSLLSQFHPDSAAASASSDDTPQKVQLAFDAEFTNQASVVGSVSRSRLGSGDQKTNASTKHFFNSHTVTVSVNRELRAVSGPQGSTKHIELDISGCAGLTYETAENLACLPLNDASQVQELAAVLGYDLDQCFNLVPVEGQEFRAAFPTPCSVREALSMFFDISGPPRHAVITRLLPYVTDPEQKKWLESLVSKENRHHFHDFVVKNGISIHELLTNQLTSCKLPLADFLNLVPFLQPRFYTISSSASCFPTSIHVTVSVVNQPLENGKVVNGVCSTYMAGLAPGSTCKVFLRASSFKLPVVASTPIILIGPGTGIAPMRALLQEREFQKSAGQQVGPNVLYFGCRRRDEDYIYRDELEQYEQTGVLDQLHLAFSRMGSQKEYVQHLMRRPENASALLTALDNGAHVYVCGATAMGADVLEAFVDIIHTHKGVSKEDAAAQIKALQDQLPVSRYVQELWSA